MKTLFKIILILLAVFPLWVTIMAMAAPAITSEELKMTLNRQLMTMSTDERRMQIIQLAPSMEPLDPDLFKTKFKVEISDFRGIGTVPLEVRFFDSEGRLSKLAKMTARILVEEKALVTTRSITRGETLQEADVTFEWINVSRYGNSRPLAKNEVVGHRARVGLRAMAPLVSGQVEMPSMVRAGDRVEIRVVGNSLAVTGFGIARQSGEKGDTIRVVNPDSRKEIFGVITDAKKVEVQL